MRQFKSWIVAWASLIDGVVSVLTLGYYWPNLAMKTLVWRVRSDIKKKIEKENT